jgi:hypothetical protein
VGAQDHWRPQILTLKPLLIITASIGGCRVREPLLRTPNEQHMYDRVRLAVLSGGSRFISLAHKAVNPQTRQAGSAVIRKNGGRAT